MYPILEKQQIGPDTYRMRILAPRVARRAQPGQFVMLRVDEDGERIPLTIAGFDRVQETIDIIFQAVGGTTRLLAGLPAGGALHDFLGPLGRPAELPNHGRVICVGGGVDYDFADQAGLIERDLDAVLAFNARILRGARKLLAPSRDTAERYRARFGLDDIAVVPHPEPRLPASRRHAHRASTGTPLRVAVVGAIVVHKGFELLLRLAECAARARAPFHLTVIGHTPDTPSLVATASACLRQPLVKMNLRPGRLASAAAKAGEGSTAPRSMSCT